MKRPKVKALGLRTLKSRHLIILQQVPQRDFIHLIVCNKFRRGHSFTLSSDKKVPQRDFIV